MKTAIYNLSVCCVDGVTIFGCISDDKALLSSFLQHHDRLTRLAVVFES